MKYIYPTFCVLSLFFCMLTGIVKAQHKLNSLVSTRVRQVKLSALLDTIEKKNGFYFSYSNDQIRTDSLINLSVSNLPLRAVLDTLFNGKVDYKEIPGYVILRLAPHNLRMDAETEGGKEHSYDISGYVLDEQTGLGLPNASVYEKRLLVSTLTDQKGFFKIRIKGSGMVTLSVSKEFYRDASVTFLSDVTISVQPENTGYNADSRPSKTEKNWLGRLFISPKQKIQSLNLAGYFKTVPFQTSLMPGLSSHGMMSSEVLNHFSLNILGGYTAGLDGIELAGLFNLNKQDVRYLQMAGLFNVTGGNFSGVQLAGIGNNVSKKLDGLQMAGIYNQVKDSLKGAQFAGIVNHAGGKVNGVQVAGILNKARVMDGFSLGLINIADTLNGYAVGLLNFSRNGYHKIQVYSNEIAPVNVGFKTGNQKLYSVLTAGVNPNDRGTYFIMGFGIGHDFIFNDRFLLSAEASSLTLQARKWGKSHMISRLSTLMNFNISSTMGLFAGPSFNLYYDQGSGVAAEQQQITRNKPGLMHIGNNKAWIGWTAGFSFL
ncbi:carboxypeptidase-like regulatory domain-containing protein [Pedobacter sp. AW31-3R]|uniref:carboxypeptidase-like regulatory domain-containing protein n=1 Tax=Pedobacter sp. AW31-3R TaxID=3445781 RepID=UPI003F9EEE39